MPIYSYVCKECGHNFDLLVGVVSEKIELKCEKCNSKNIEKLLGSFNVGNFAGKSLSSANSCSTGTCTTGICPTCF